ncbi:glycoside hydrolase family 88 protein [Fulvivirga sediminis]|uniref:Glycoside hydrolase family 88 protein n=1 Tax=Fulvivirga sediminis TaxID=2803949 RepID=A0A937FBM9_9BACT|nr:glycoside hydrolase family 88 protein [Fulvivirga sediminis]MBL3658214.1 glycoside hydrolase family 88 protein [Fulvivirga sediminis]
MKTTFTFLITVFLFFNACTPDKLAEMSRENFEDGASQYKYMMKKLPDGVFPKTFENGEFKTSGSGWWCSGFYPGSLIYLYEQTKDDSLLMETKRILEILKKEQYNTTTHDLGFMMYCSFGNMQTIDPKPEYKEILLNSAKSLSSRFSEKTACIKSWDSKKEDFLVIIDNMMNLELLFWATQETGDSTYYDIAVTHANTTMENHFRPDYSSYHVLNYDSQTGEVKEKRTAQGYADSSAWARGQSWGLYGYTVVYRFTHDEKYLKQAEHIANFILNHPNLPEDKIPYWDYDVPNIPNAKRDASAGAVMGSAFLELAKYVDQESADKYKAAAKTIIETLSSPEYKAEICTNGGFVLKHSVGHFDQGTEVDVPLTYADYYFFEAMKRYLEW